MHGSTQSPAATGWRGLDTPRRNNFFHGKMMDVYHFELETAYGIGLRRLLNRLVHGAGVVCGLDVERTDDHRAITVTPGVALDGWGREIVVPARSAPVTVPPELIERVCGADGDTKGKRPPRDQDQDRGYRDRGWVTAVLCYHECESDPAPVLDGDCGTTQPCTPGTISERYRIGFEPGRADPPDVSCRFPDVLRDGEIDYGAIARWVTRECPRPPRDPCIPLANLRLSDDGRPAGDVEIEDVQIEVREVVLGRLLFDVLSRVVEEEQSGDSWRR
ncbi:hypothetical protein GCM10010112_12760 [Actinoplanes lobatus]|uniref:Uncharacterized protein n=1 Tax=Actinoplanes lobatus TaxID=113568 RepID=A0A7W7HM60_9ACTN|nr:hypothetical protein [Actinoplanes lobatus]MBB4753114.1 hypothetical protein [Actinoplanes lobatus]GGN58743.1 hypothetical protein GCM10010112_12760 [Actinoplanes lobatus]GIE43026.1 hypothetical protein Alo02nite_59240 [Actinoplanes lobatus]